MKKNQLFEIVESASGSKIKNFNNFEDDIKYYLNEATNDCKNSMLNNNINNGIGLVFITPYWDIKLDKNDELSKFENELLKQNYDIIGTFTIDVKDKEDQCNLHSSQGNTCNAVYIIGNYLSKKDNKTSQPINALAVIYWLDSTVKHTGKR